MHSIIQNALEGDRASLEELYMDNRQEVYFLASCLLNNQTLAVNASIWAFKNLWTNNSLEMIQTGEEFTRAVIKKVVEYCKRNILKQSPNAFRTPADRNFLFSRVVGTMPIGVPFDTVVLSHFPPLQRFILVLHTVGGYDNEQLAATFKFDAKTIDAALAAEQENVGRIARHYEFPTYSYSQFIEDFLISAQKTTVPRSVDEQIAIIIDELARPGEKKFRRNMLVSIFAILLCLFGGTALLLFGSSPKDDSASSAEEVVSTLDEAEVSESPESLSGSTEDIDSSAEETISLEDDETAPSATSPLPTSMLLDENSVYYADISIQDYGTITIQLDQASAPNTAANFASLVESGFYDGLTFHRIIDGFMMQGGDPNGDGTGGAETTIVGEFSANGYDNTLSHTRGAVSMARGNDYDSASSQFFIVQEDSTYLDGEYAVFGYVTEGMDIVDEICASALPTDDNGTIPADEQPVITSITLRVV